MSAATEVLEQRKFQIEQDLQDRNSHRNHLQAEVGRIQKLLKAAETNLSQHNSQSVAMREDLASINKAIRIVREDEREQEVEDVDDLLEEL